MLASCRTEGELGFPIVIEHLSNMFHIFAIPIGKPDAPAPRHAGRVWRARARERRLTEQTEGFFGTDGWFCPHERGEGDGWTPRKICFIIPYTLATDGWA